jgi:signal peptidase I
MRTDPVPVQTEGPPPPPPPPTTEDAGGSPPKRRSFFKELPVLIVIAFAIALIIKSFALQAFYIPSASMEPTLKEGDRVLVEKVSQWWSEPSRGDVVVFERDLQELVGGAPKEDEPFWTDVGNAFKGLFGFPTGTAQDFIKRVIAVEGETVEGRDGHVFINGEMLEEPYLPDGVETSVFGPTTVGEGEIFVMGDNRPNSDDSRNFGPVRVDDIVGRAFLLIWPPADFGTL